jgi:hypothetical protein
MLDAVLSYPSLCTTMLSAQKLHSPKSDIRRALDTTECCEPWMRGIITYQEAGAASLERGPLFECQERTSAKAKPTSSDPCLSISPANESKELAATGRQGRLATDPTQHAASASQSQSSHRSAIPLREKRKSASRLRHQMSSPGPSSRSRLLLEGLAEPNANALRKPRRSRCKIGRAS